MAKFELAGSVRLPDNRLSHVIACLFDFDGSMDQSLIEEIRMRYHSPPPIASSEEAIRSTWQAVGDSMCWAIGEYEKELDEKSEE
ncbi:MAG: hypothetical protein F4X02_12920 [Chloroflexi bacterium]|nr:hypothetical protein [Chloroflexota bacterium]